MSAPAVRVGDILPLDGARKPFGGARPPAWFILTCGRQRRDMDGAREWLVAHGATECWFPEDVERRNIRRGHKTVREMVRLPIVPGMIFMLSGLAPTWDVIEARKRIRPMRIGERAVAVSDDVMAEMSMVPERVVAMRDALADAERRARDERVPRVGEFATFSSGLLRGQIGMIERIIGDEVVIMVDGVRFRATAGDMVRLASGRR